MLVWFITYPSKLLGLRGSRLSSSRSEMTTSLGWGPHTELWTKMGRNSGPNSHPPKSRDPRAGEKTSVWPCYGRREDSSAERQGRRGASQAQRRPSPPSAEEARRRCAGSGGAASVLLQLQGAKHSPGRVGDRPFGGASKRPCSRNSDDGPFANHYRTALPGFMGGSWTHYLPSDVPFHLRPGSPCKGNTQPDTSKTGGGGVVCTGRVIKMLLFLGEKLAT